MALTLIMLPFGTGLGRAIPALALVIPVVVAGIAGGRLSAVVTALVGGIAYGELEGLDLHEHGTAA